MSPSSPTLTRTAGIMFEVMPPTNPSSAPPSFIFDDHISDYGGVADGNYAIIPVTTTAGSTNVTVSSGIFIPGDVGKRICIATGQPSAVIAGYNSSSSISISSGAAATITSCTHCIAWGTDNGSVTNGGNGAFDSFATTRASLSSGTGRLRCSSGVYFISYGNPLFQYVRNFVLDATNTTFAGQTLQFGNPGQHQFDSSAFGGPFSARTSSATAGNSFVDLTTSSFASLFTVGDYAMMTGLDLQGGVSFPSNPFYFEHLLVSVVDNSSPSPTYGRISFATALQNSYRTDWPTWASVSSIVGGPDHGGPATLYVLYPYWNCNHTYNLAGVADDVPPGVTGRTMAFNGTTFEMGATNGGTVYPTQCGSVTFSNCVSSHTSEVDKLNDLITYNNCTANVVNWQSPNNQLRGTGNTINILLGCAKDTVLSNCTINTLKTGPNVYAQCTTVSLSNCVIGTITQPGGCYWKGPYSQNVNSNGMLMSSGRITIPASLFSSNANGANSSDGGVLGGWAVPGGRYLWTDGNRSGFGLFTITSITTDSCGVQVQTDWTQSSGTFPPYSTAAGNILWIQSHPAPSFQLTACSATAPAGTNDNSLPYNLSQAGSARPLWSYFKQTNSASAVNSSGSQLWGYLSSATVAVTGTYVGADPNPRLDPFGSFMWLTDPSTGLNVPNYVPKISVASSAGTGTRSWSFGASPSTSVTFTGFKAEDSGYNPIAFGPPSWSANGVHGFLDNGITGTMTVVTEVKTDQGF